MTDQYMMAEFLLLHTIYSSDIESIAEVNSTLHSGDEAFDEAVSNTIAISSIHLNSSDLVDRITYIQKY